jgi:hypothetical protein
MKKRIYLTEYEHAKTWRDLLIRNATSYYQEKSFYQPCHHVYTFYLHVALEALKQDRRDVNL